MKKRLPRYDKKGARRGEAIRLASRGRQRHEGGNIVRYCEGRQQHPGVPGIRRVSYVSRRQQGRDQRPVCGKQGSAP